MIHRTRYTAANIAALLTGVVDFDAVIAVVVVVVVGVRFYTFIMNIKLCFLDY